MAGHGVKRKAYRSFTIHVETRVTRTPAPGSAEPRHRYEHKFTTRADPKSHSGVSEFAKVSVKDTAVTHTFAINYTNLKFDIRDRIRDARGNLYQILKVENVDNADIELRIFCAETGDKHVEAAR